MCSFKGEFRCFSGLFPHMLQSTSSFVQSVKLKRKDWPWWTARCSAPCQSSAEVPSRPKKSLIHFFFFKVPLRQSSVALHTHPQTNQQICRKRADFKVLLWFSGGCAVVDVSRERVRHLAGLPGFCQRAPGRLSLWAHFYKSGERGRIQRRWAGCSLFYTRSQTQWGESLK